MLPDAPPARPLRTAVVQSAARPLDIAANAREAAARCERAAAGGARLVVLSELHLTAYDVQGLADAPDSAVLSADDARSVLDDRLAPLAAATARHRLTVLVGAPVRHPDGRLTNSLLAVTPDGAVTVAYDKRHLWQDTEAALFTPGAPGPALLTVDGWRIGPGVCYDMSFPEHARAAALAGAHAVVYASAFAAGSEYRAAVYCRARALENTVYTVFANPLDGPLDRPCAGSSAVHAPDGTTLAEAAPGEDTVLVADLTPGRLADVRRHLRMLAELRTSAPA
ncbi:carbon-nitrogen hydrolase family protein [Streptomyces sp. GESEQ-13]|uniref:carbon-nitrogen hydrolase family protein n=1 Tax=Streptomyces sp. GESEQ-13 TaxID=2812654 RepID=UPI001FF0CCDB